MLKIRRPLGRLIFNMGIAIPGKTVFLIETAPRAMILKTMKYSPVFITNYQCKWFLTWKIAVMVSIHSTNPATFIDGLYTVCSVRTRKRIDVFPPNMSLHVFMLLMRPCELLFTFFHVNEKRRYNVTSSLIVCAHTQHDSYTMASGYKFSRST